MIGSKEMEEGKQMKEKGLYIGIGLLIGVGVGLLSFSKINIIINTVGHLDKLTITKCDDNCKEVEKKFEST